MIMYRYKIKDADGNEIISKIVYETPTEAMTIVNFWERAEPGAKFQELIETEVV